MACQYCGAEAAVPDLEQRSKKEERRGGGGEGAGRLPHRPVVVSRFPMAPVMIAFLMAMAGIGLSRAGFFESMMGDAGESQLKLAEERIRASGFSPTGDVKEEWWAFFPRPIYVRLEKGGCQALAVGADKPLRGITLENPSGQRVGRHETLRYHDALLYCPAVSGLFKATIQLDQPGRYSWRLHRNPQGRAELEKEPGLQRKKKRKRKKKRRPRRRVKEKTRREADPEPREEIQDPGFKLPKTDLDRALEDDDDVEIP